MNPHKQMMRTGVVKRTSKQHLDALALAAAKAPDNKQGFPDGLFPHPRFLSRFQSNQVVIAVGHKSNILEKSRTIDLDLINIACIEGRGIYNTPQRLSNFPNLVIAAKSVINTACERYHDGSTVTDVSRELRIFQHFCSWMLSEGIYQLADITMSKTDSLLKELASRSWRGVCRHRRLFALLLREIKEDPKIADSFVSRCHVSLDTLNINVDSLERYLGVPLHGNYVPNRIRRAIAAATGNGCNRVSYYSPLPSLSELKHTIHTINSISQLHEDLDSIPFLPFPNPNKTIKELLPPERAKELAQGKNTFVRRMRQTGQTPNMTPRDYAKAFEVFVTYTLDYGPSVCELMEAARAKLEPLLLEGNRISSERRSPIMQALASKSHSLAMDGRLPWAIVEKRGSERSLPELIKLTIAAAGGLVALNHARRANEIVGYGVPYGLYFGCLEELSAFPPAFQIDVYIEKGIQDYRSFPANGLVRDAIGLLERMHILMRATGATVPAYSLPRADGRKQKLFEMRPLAGSGLSRKPESLNIRPYLVRLLLEAGVDPSSWDGHQMPFRRAFTTLFTRRYDLVEYPAIQAHLGHLVLSTTVPYQFDTVERPLGTSVQELHGHEAVQSEQALLFEDLAASRAEYLRDGVRRLLEGSFIGGKFSTLVLALVKRLSASADFAQLDIDRKAGLIAANLSRRGYSPDAMRHNACAAGTARHTRSGSNCYRDGSLRKEEANSEMCSGCVHSWTNDNYLKALRDEFSTCVVGKKDERLTPSERVDFSLAAEKISAILESEAQIASANREKLAKFSAAWQKITLQALKKK